MQYFIVINWMYVMRIAATTTRWLHCVDWTQYSIRSKRSAIYNISFPGPTKVLKVNGISIASEFAAGRDLYILHIADRFGLILYCFHSTQYSFLTYLHFTLAPTALGHKSRLRRSIRCGCWPLVPKCPTELATHLQQSTDSAGARAAGSSDAC